MKRGMVLLLLVLTVFAFGCSQKNPIIQEVLVDPDPVVDTTPVVEPTPEASGTFTLNGKVYLYDYLAGSADMTRPIVGATVTVTGTIAAATATATGGSYSFDGLPVGQYTISVSKEGYRWRGKASNSTSYNFSSQYYVDSTQEASFALDARPVFLGGSMNDHAEVPASQINYKLYFSKPMKTDSVTAFIKYISLRSADVSAKSSPVTSVAWEDGNRTLSVTASSVLLPDALYHLGLACSNAGFGIEGIKDTEGDPIYGTKLGDSGLYNSSSDSLYGTYIYVPFKTAPVASTPPAQPAKLSVRSIATGSIEVNYDSVYKGSSGGVALQFDAVSGANGYRLYASRDNVTYHFVKEFFSPSLTVYVRDIVGALGLGCAMGYETTGHPVEPGLPWPFLGTGTYLRVSAYNSLGEGPRSESMLVTDTLPPSAVGTSTEVESTSVKVVRFNEPVDLSTVKNTGNYSFSATSPPTVVSVEAVNDYNYAYAPYQTTYARLFLSKNDSIARTLTINNIKDLTGNLIKSAITLSTK